MLLTLLLCMISNHFICFCLLVKAGERIRHSIAHHLQIILRGGPRGRAVKSAVS